MAKTKKWTAKQVEDTRREIEDYLTGSFDESDGEGKLAWLLEQIGGSAGETDDLLLRQFVNIILALEQHAVTGLLKKSDTNKLFETANLILATMGIDRANSRLSFLHTELLRLQSGMQLEVGNHFQAIWLAELAKVFIYRPTERQISVNALTSARAYARRGLISLALSSYEIALQEGPSTPFYYDVRLETGRLFRIIGSIRQARHNFEEIVKSCSNESTVRKAKWELLATKMIEVNAPEVFFAGIRKEHNNFGTILLCKLWLYSHRTRGLPDRIAKAESLRKRFKDETTDINENNELYKVVRLMEDCFDAGFPLQTRMEKLGEALALGPSLNHVEHEILLRAASVRWAQRFSQEPALNYLLNEFHLSNKKLTAGIHTDPMNLVGDVKVYDPSSLKAEERGYLLETSHFKRRWTIGKMAGKSAGIVISNRVRRIIASETERERLKEEELTQLGEIWFRTLSELKGGAMKIGQHLGITPQVPDAFREQLTLLHDRALSVDPSLSIGVIESEFGKPVDELFATFNPNPVATGSVGQVFRVTTHEGRELAVKVRHPGIVEALKSDLASMTLVKPILAQMMPKADMKSLINEMRSLILQETDYRREATNQKFFRSICHETPGVVVPEIIDEYCSDQIITMEYLEGRRFPEFMAMASVEEKSDAAVAMIKSMVNAFAMHNVFNGDPHPGNYLFLDDGNIALLDFGCVKEFPEQMKCHYVDTIWAIMTENRELSHESWAALGYGENSERFDYELQYELVKSIFSPFLVNEPVRLTNERIQHIQELHVEGNPNLKETSPPQDAAVMVRVTWGFNAIMTSLGAEANWHQLLTDGFNIYWNKYPDRKVS